LRVVARRFCCTVQHCRRRIFAERFDETALLVRSRRTRRLDCVVHHLGLALGGRPAASFAKRLMLPVSNDTVLREVRAQACPRPEPLNVVGIDDWAFRRNHSYGTIVCDLERRRIVTLLPGREMATVEAWLAGHPDIKVLSRDRGGGCGEAASKALPCAIQVADRWHLMENASSAFLSAVRKSMRPIRAAIGATAINPELLTCAERRQCEGYLRREETIAKILALAKDGAAIKQIVRKTGHSRNRVHQVLRGDRGDVFRTRQSPLDACLPLLDAQWADGCRNAAKLWRRLKSDGFRGSQRVVSEWATRRRRAEKASDQQLQKVPSARTIARLMTTARDHTSKADTITIAGIEAGVPPLVAARTLTDRFHIMVKQRTEADLVPWIAAASRSLIASFASGITKDIAAVHAALVQPWSNGQTEGQTTKLKLGKRQMYGRAKIDLLQARLIGAT
ncbi:MAG TPA: ISL3 family transposase, partial [Acidisoma sp.]|nr:ISL3 family transposase [Acidisoma sp.]